MVLQEVFLVDGDVVAPFAESCIWIALSFTAITLRNLRNVLFPAAPAVMTFTVASHKVFAALRAVEFAHFNISRANRWISLHSCDEGELSYWDSILARRTPAGLWVSS